MRRSVALRALAPVLASVACCLSADCAFAQSEPAVALVVPGGRALRVRLTSDTTVRRVGDTVTGQLVEPLYAYDRIVLPAGTTVQGRITKLTEPSKLNRARAMGAGDFSPHRQIELRFESVVLDGRTTAIETIARNESLRPQHAVARNGESTSADAGENPGAVARAKAEVQRQASGMIASVKHQASDALSAVRDPGRLDRLKEWGLARLPYRRQVLRKGTVYDAELLTSLDFGTTAPHPEAPVGTLPAPDSILAARLLTTLDSHGTPRGSPLEAIISQPVFAEDGRLIFPEGTRLTGEVTFAQPARRFHRNGRLRFLFERVQPPDRPDSAPMLAALHAIDVDGDARVALDDEGGAAVQNSKTRFVEPALALLALRASFEQGEGRGFDGGSPVARPTSVSAGGGNSFARGVGGLIGFGAIGFVLGRASRPLGIAFGAVGAARSVYKNVLGRGQEVTFPADTPIEIQLAPGRTDSR